jgi:hypothetical protein
LQEKRKVKGDVISLSQAWQACASMLNQAAGVNCELRNKKQRKRFLQIKRELAWGKKKKKGGSKGREKDV